MSKAPHCTTVVSCLLLSVDLAILREEMIENNALKRLNSGRISSALNCISVDGAYSGK